MKHSPAILVTTPTSPIEEKQEEGMQRRETEGRVKISSSTVGLAPSPTASRMSFLNVDDDTRKVPEQRGGSLAAIRRHTVMLARDVLLRRVSRNDSASSPIRRRITLDDFGKLVHEVNHMVAAYRQLLQSIGTYSESAHTRKELSSCRRQCLRNCESAKECIMPLLRENESDPRGSNQSSELAKHACHQFIGCLNMFITEMKRTMSLFRAEANVTRDGEIAKDDSSYFTATGSSADIKADGDLENVTRDLKEAEMILETLENAITVHFATEPSQQTGPALQARRTKKSTRHVSKFCVYFKTKYA